VEYKENILEQVRCTAALSIIQLCRFKQLNDDNKAFVSTLARVVDAFAGDPHWENPMALGLAHHLEGKFDEAIGSYEKAISCLQGDPTRNPAFLNMIPEVEMAIRDARAHKPVHELKIHI
jgi:tetratricopeptide (TPR) repeat protein